MKLRWIEWEDSCNTYGWHDNGEFALPIIAASVGFVHKETDDYVMLVMTYDDQEPPRWLNSVTVPTSAIRKQWDVDFE